MLNDPELSSGGGSGGGGSGTGGGGGSAPPAGGGQDFIQVTPEEKAAIERVGITLGLLCITNTVSIA